MLLRTATAARQGDAEIEQGLCHACPFSSTGAQLVSGPQLVQEERVARAAEAATRSAAEALLE